MAMRRSATTITEHSNRAMAAKLRAEAAEAALIEGDHPIPDAEWREREEADARGLTYAEWARKRRAVFRGIMRSFANRLDYRGPLFGGA